MEVGMDTYADSTPQHKAFWLVYSALLTHENSLTLTTNADHVRTEDPKPYNIGLSIPAAPRHPRCDSPIPLMARTVFGEPMRRAFKYCVPEVVTNCHCC